MLNPLNNSIKATGPGYQETVFKDKSKQMQQVGQLIKEKGYLPAELVDSEVSWFYGHLGIDDQYFQHNNPTSIANHIVALYGAKITSYSKQSDNSPLEIHLEQLEQDVAVIIHSSKPGISATTGPQVERTIDSKYLDSKSLYRLESYRSHGTISSNNSTQVRCYFLKKCQFKQEKPNEIEQLDIQLVGDKVFLEKATENTIQVYQNCMRLALKRTGPVIESYDMPSREKRLVIAYKQQTTTNFFSSMSDLYHYYDLYSTRKYVEQFSNGITIMSFYLNPLPNIKIPIEQSIYQIIKEASLIYCLPTTPLHTYFQTNILSIQETMYGYSVWLFCQHFLNRLGSEYKSLSRVLDPTNPSHLDVLTTMKKRLRTDTFTREYILDIISNYPDLIKALYIHFAMDHYVSSQSEQAQPTLSFQRINTMSYTTNDLLAMIKQKTVNKHDYMVFECILNFNIHVIKTNFYTPTKVAISYKLNPSFLPDQEYPNRPFGLFMVIGTEFRGFHVRFRDVARGGIRIIKSRNKESYSINCRTLFDENYALASTQQRKNKDIPEGGSKGTILLDVTCQDKSKQAFEKYTDSLLDLLLPGNSDGKPLLQVKQSLTSSSTTGDKSVELLFFGPDEGTADVMDWAALHCKSRGAMFWKAFTTGKSQSLGGIPHDLYGMTTTSVHSYVLGCYRKLGLQEHECTKLQTGGPDGDLGSNEIKMSSDKTCGIVDGSGVIWDPLGLNRQELLRLATARRMINEFDITKLSSEGFRVLVDEQNVKLPNGKTVENGLQFRNEFHLNKDYSVDVFVPCGGRPESVDLTNVDKLVNCKVIVEGANLFFTQDARLKLEQQGVLIIKDASANKGGVTSSSMEVLAALAFDDQQFEQCMMNYTSDFYTAYIKQVQHVIKRNAELEFECLWREGELTGKCKSLLSDELSWAIVKLKEELVNCSLWDSKGIRTKVLQEALPSVLVKEIGFDKVVDRVPDAYLRAIFGTYLASRFVYKYGINAPQMAFFEFIAPYMQ